MSSVGTEIIVVVAVATGMMGRCPWKPADAISHRGLSVIMEAGLRPNSNGWVSAGNIIFFGRGFCVDTLVMSFAARDVQTDQLLSCGSGGHLPCQRGSAVKHNVSSH